MESLSSAVAAAAGTGGLQAWIKDNIIPLLLLLIAVMLFVLAQRGDNAKAMRVVGGVVIALGVLVASRRWQGTVLLLSLIQACRPPSRWRAYC